MKSKKSSTNTMKTILMFPTLIYLLLSASFLTLTMVGCCEKDDVTSPANAIPGAWEITFVGTFEGKTTVIINDDGSFYFSIVDGQNAVVSMTGQVDLSTKKVVGSVTRIGLTDQKGLTGLFNTNGTGSGTYEWIGLAIGSWTALKK
jgi:hypothetical protein